MKTRSCSSSTAQFKSPGERCMGPPVIMLEPLLYCLHMGSFEVLFSRGDTLAGGWINS